MFFKKLKKKKTFFLMTRALNALMGFNRILLVAIGREF